MNKIGKLEEELRRKDVVIASYELRMAQLGKRLSGDQQRMRLMEQMQVELDLYRIRIQENNSVIRQ